MNKKVEVLLTILALAGLYSAMPTMTKSSSRPVSSGIRAEQVVIVADGSDPMPLCRRRHCTQETIANK
jgi:hypothetical protein